ncbi:MAG: SUMF1/EgtB/PvdO family nonheme iron enzyme [Verrucomicrobia bacterium]|nr:SUMF1/EgtB/PvdO family nonheme iron enzyme [Verrucomicrobiota bacterium]MCH8510474.1 SUMF1/EgtB/PvdO family nonheme iron enzyme [Kiritimatiellia bacterium]
MLRSVARTFAWIGLPTLGTLLALGFRPSETDWRTFSEARNPKIAHATLALPDGQAIRLLGVPDIGGGPAFFLGEREITRAEFRAFDPSFEGHPGSAAVSHAQALAFCEWLSQRSGRRVRLPTLAEWRLAARGGIPNAEFPWGFSRNLRPRGVRFALDTKPRRPGPPLGYGFRDLAGGLWEWTVEGRAIGGAWSERDPDRLRIDTAISLPDGYRDEDSGFRILVEE